jgi:hypothetical protein
MLLVLLAVMAVMAAQILEVVEVADSKFPQLAVTVAPELLL